MTPDLHLVGPVEAKCYACEKRTVEVLSALGLQRDADFDAVHDALEAGGYHPYRTTGQWFKAFCPCHPDHNNPNLHFRATSNGNHTARKVGRPAKQSKPWELDGLRGKCERPDVYPARYLDEDGRTLFLVCRFETPGKGKEYPQFRPDGRMWVAGLNGTRRVLFRLPSLLTAITQGADVHILEGEVCVHAAGSLGLVATTWPGGANGTWLDEYTQVLGSARRVIIWPDNDKPGTERARFIARELHLAGVEDVRLMQPLGTTKGYDLADWVRDKALPPPEAQAQIDSMVMDTEPWVPDEEDDTRPTIHLGVELHETTDAAMKALAKNPNTGLYVHAQRLARVVKPEGKPIISTATPETVQDLLSASARFVQHDGRRKADVPTVPPHALAKKIIALEEWPGVPHLAGISESPILRADGSVHRTEGHDPVSKMLLLPTFESPTVTLDESETSQLRVIGTSMSEDLEIISKVTELLFPFSAYRFKNPLQDLGAVLSLILTPIARHAIGAPVPMFMITSPVRGSGKGKLAEAALVIATGRVPATQGAPRSGDEWRKLLLSVAIEGAPVFYLDNIDNDLRSGELSRAITSGKIKDRILGVSQTAEADWTATVVVTGNNITLTGDLPRRTVPITIDTGLEFPDQKRFGFCPVEQALGARPELHAIALAILERHAKLGFPRHEAKAIGSFEQWDRWVRGAVMDLGFPDPIGGREEILRAADSDREKLREFMDAWLEAFGKDAKTSNEVIEKAKSMDRLRNALASIDRNGDPTKVSSYKLAAFLRRHRNAPLAGRKIDFTDTEHRAAVWRIVETEAGHE